MSRVGKKPIELPKGVKVEAANGQLKISGPKGELTRPIPPDVDVNVDGSTLKVVRLRENRRARAMHGLLRALASNMVTGVSEGYNLVLDINGVGYRAESKKGVLALSLGYSHPIEVMLPEGVTAKADKGQVTISGVDKELLGQLAAVIRAQRPPEPFKGKGIKYQDETIRRKAGKAGAAA